MTVLRFMAICGLATACAPWHAAAGGGGETLVSPPRASNPEGQESAWGPDGRSYVFWDDRTGNTDVFILDLESATVSNLTNKPGEDANAVFSPDKNKLALFISVEGNGEIFLMNPDGSDKQNLTRHPGPDFNPSWSPDGSKIAFQSHRDGHAQIYVMNRGGSDQRNLSTAEESDSNPAWSPDGGSIAFVSRRGEDTEIFLMNPDGSGRRQLTRSERGFHNPKWSPDGRTLVFHSDEPDSETGADLGSIFLLDLQTGLLRELTDPEDGDYDFNPFFDESGTKIGFNSLVDGKMEIHVLTLGTAEEAVLYSESLHLEVAWSRPLGSGYSEVTHHESRLFTLYAESDSDYLIALDSDTGKEHWRYRIGDHFAARGGSTGGPASAAVVAEAVVYGLGSRGELFALDRDDGTEIWTLSLVEMFGARAPYYGFATTPLVAGDLLFVQAGGEHGRSLIAVERKTGKLRWATADDRLAYHSPILATLAGRRQIVAVTETRILGLAPDSGQVLWAADHEVGGHEGGTRPVPVGSDRVLLAGTYNTVMFLVERQADEFTLREVWRNRELKGSFSTAVVHGDFIYGFSDAFLTCVSVADGSKHWRSRSPGGQALIGVGDHLAISAGGGVLVLARTAPEGYQEEARLELFEDDSYTAPGLAGDTILVRDERRIAAVRIRPGAAPATVSRADSEPDTRFAAFVRAVEGAEDRRDRIDAFMEAQTGFPIVEGERYVHFVYRGEAEDVAVAGSMIELHDDAPLRRIDGTDFFYRTFAIEPGVRWEYHFIVDFDDGRADPLNPRRLGDRRSELVMPGWSRPSHVEPYEGRRSGRIEEWVHESRVLAARRDVSVYIPYGYYPAGSRAYPLLIVDDGTSWRELGGLPNSLNQLLEGAMEPVIVAFVAIPPELIPDEFAGERVGEHVRMLTDELVPAIERRYRIREVPTSRAILGVALGGSIAAQAAIERPDVFGHAGVISVQLIEPVGTRLIDAIEAAPDSPRAQFHILWSRYELRSTPADFDLGRDTRRLFRALTTAGFDVTGREVPDASGWSGWSAQVGEILTGIFDRGLVEGDKGE